MPCSCHGKPKSQPSLLTQEAMWSLAFATTGRSTSMLPPSMRPMRAAEALSQISRATDDGAASRMWAAFGMLQNVSGAAQRLPPAQIEAFAETGFFVPDAVIFLAEQFSALLHTSLALMVNFLRQLAELKESPCFDPVSCGTFAGKTHQTALDSYVTVRKPLSKVAPLLDPRAWANCSELFKTTCKVAEPKACVPCCVQPQPGELGTDWHGKLYEHASIGYQDVENLLSIDFSVCDIGTDRGRLKTGYSLYRSISHRVGGWELPGLMRNNSGTVTAKAVGPHEVDKEPPHTLIRVTKLIHYGRSSCWSAGSTLDFGELCNYLAPAFLTLWVTNVQFVVPCCPEKRA